MKIKTLSILFISCILLTSCNNADSVETIATVESIESVETVTEIEEPTTIEEIESTVEVEETETVTEEIETESIQFVGTEVSKFAGTTSKHGYKYPDDYIEGGPKDEDRIGDVEMLFDIGALTEEEYQEDLEFFSKSKEEIAQELMDDMGISDSGEESGGTVPGNSGAPIELPVLPETVPDGRICY